MARFLKHSHDDLGDLIINPPNATGNYIRVNGDNITFYLNEYKTKGQYGPTRNKLSRELALQIKEYIRVNDSSDGDALFGKGKMGPFVSKLVTGGHSGRGATRWDQLASSNLCLNQGTSRPHANGKI